MYIKYDMKIGIISQWRKYIIVALIFFLFCFNLYSKTTYGVMDITKEQLPNFIDYLLFFFEGTVPFTRQNGVAFNLPIMWILRNLTLAYVVGSHPINELNNFGENTLTRIKSRQKWWLYKCIWNIVSVLTFYFIGYIITSLFCLITVGDISFIPSASINGFITGNNYFFVAQNINFLFTVIALSTVVSIAISMVQMTLALIINPIFSFMVILILLVSSAFLNTGVLLCNNAMLIRNSLFIDDGINTYSAVLFSLIISVISAAIGMHFFKGYDITRKL